MKKNNTAWCASAFLVLAAVVVSPIVAWSGGHPFLLGPEVSGPPENDYSGPECFTTVGDKVFFLATTMLTGVELWVTDGTEEGTCLVRDIRAF